MSTARRRLAPADWDDASRAVAEAYFPHELRQLGGLHEPRLTLRTLDLGPVLIGHVGWGADVMIECDYPGAYEINMPLTGHLESRGRRGTVTSVVGQGTVFYPNSPSLISHWDATCAVLGVKFDSTWLDVEIERLLGPDRTTVASLLPEQLELADGRGRAWHSLVVGLAGLLRDPNLFADNMLVREQLAGTVAAGLVELCDLGPIGPRAHPRAVKMLLEQIHQDPARPWTAADMAEVAGTSVRRLQEGFRSAVGQSPTQHLLGVRLQRARLDLEQQPELTVSDIAARWGFSSSSRFAAAFRARYGSSPSEHRR